MLLFDSKLVFFKSSQNSTLELLPKVDFNVQSEVIYRPNSRVFNRRRARGFSTCWKWTLFPFTVFLQHLWIYIRNSCIEFERLFDCNKLQFISFSPWCPRNAFSVQGSSGTAAGLYDCYDLYDFVPAWRFRLHYFFQLKWRTRVFVGHLYNTFNAIDYLLIL